MSTHFKVFDVFTDEKYKGNPTPVLLLDKWIDNEYLLRIASEFNQSETAFLVKKLDEENAFDIMWFTPHKEEPFCGHACLATILFLYQTYGLEEAILYSHSYGGICIKARKLAEDLFQIDLPSEAPVEVEDEALKKKFAQALHITTNDIIQLAINSYNDYLIEVDPAKLDIASNNINAVRLLEASPPGTRSQILTSLSLNSTPNNADWIKRIFAYGDEDQATGSTYCCLVPYWSKKLGKSEMSVFQCSRRTGFSKVDIDKVSDRVLVSGTGRLNFEGNIQH